MIVGVMSDTSRDMTAAIENGNIGPDFFGLYTSEVAELLSQDDDFLPFSPQISGLAGNSLELDRDEHKFKSLLCESVLTLGQEFNEVHPDFKMERLKSLLCESVLTLGQEFNEDFENEHVHLDVSGKEVSNNVKKSPQLRVGSDGTKVPGT
ncbi:Beta-galactosidase [Olea europaea subsp. europaea]|uniref:Beta-galactosidase n=1 Tax=Olea europaea subsp. europaea TaxID=158383 RepID=A0A8S0SNI9_OLEEU|nr:Beta-galactosidase [Olea europaea subsp. europaea]